MPKLAALPVLFLFSLPALAANTLLHNATIHTVDADNPEASAMVFSDAGEIVAVGEEEALREAYPDAGSLDAGGHTVVPGLIDAHAHLMGLGQSLTRADLQGTASKAGIVEILKRHAESLPPGAWLLGRGWDQNDWPEKAFPGRDVLDHEFPHRPVWLTRIDGHAGWANTAALQAAGIYREPPPDPEGGRILRDDDGRPSGVLVDAAMGLVERAVPEATLEQRARALRLALEKTTSRGLTGIHEAGTTLTDTHLYQAAIDAGQFPVRVYAMAAGQGDLFERLCSAGAVMIEGKAQGHRLEYEDRLIIGAVKFYADGALGSRGAALLEPYGDDPDNRGLLQMQPADYQRAVTRAMECGLQVNTHAIGDRGNRMVLDAYEKAIEATGGGAGRHRVEHAQVVAPEDFERFAELDLIASMQPTHATSDMPWAGERVGPERIEGAYAWRRFLDAGVRLALGSDFPVERVDPLEGIYAAVTRQDAEGEPKGGWYPDQRLTRAEALKGFTLDAAYAAFMEDRVGSLAPGKRADFVILSRDILEVPAPEILKTRVLATYLDGKAVYRAR